MDCAIRRQTSIKDASATAAPLYQWQGPGGHTQGFHILPPNLIMEGAVFFLEILPPPNLPPYSNLHIHDRFALALSCHGEGLNMHINELLRHDI